MPNPKEDYTDPEQTQKFRRWWQGQMEPKEYPPIDPLPPLGNALMSHLVSHYGAEAVALAANKYMEADKKAHILITARDEIDILLNTLDKILNKPDPDRWK